MEAVDRLVAALMMGIALHWPTYLLAAARIAGLLATLHVALRRFVPISVQALVLAFVPLLVLPAQVPRGGDLPQTEVVPVAGTSADPPASSAQTPVRALPPTALVAACAAELTRGAGLGLAVLLVLWAIPAAGGLVDEHLGWTARDVLFGETTERGFSEWFVAAGALGILGTSGSADASGWLGAVLTAIVAVPLGEPIALGQSAVASVGQLLTAATILALTLVAPLLAVLYAAEVIRVVVHRGWPAAAGMLPAETVHVMIVIVLLAVLLPQLGLAIQAGVNAFGGMVSVP